MAQDEVDEITVTGSRIVRRDLTAASPIVTIDSTQLENSSSIGVESVLNRQPQFVPADTQFDTAGTEVSAFSTPGIATVNLRGLGPNRNLVLIDGRRAQPANATLVVDINTIPSAAIARIETITGGASAVYGPDALAGVVNFQLKDDFEGAEMDLQTGMTAEGDGEESRFSSLIGMNNGDGTGNVMLGVEWSRREPVRALDRDFYTAQMYDPHTRIGGTIQNGGYAATSNQPSQAAIDQVFAKYGVAPGTIARSREFNFNPDGTIYDFQTGVGYNGPIARMDVVGDGFTGIKVEPNGALGQDPLSGNISSPMERRSLFGRAVYDITDNMTSFVQANFSSVEVDQVAGFVPATSNWAADGIPVDGRYIPSDLATLLASRAQPTATWVMNRGLDFLGNERTHNQTDAYQVMAGLEGTLAVRDWTWETYVATGETDQSGARPGIRLAAALPCARPRTQLGPGDGDEHYAVDVEQVRAQVLHRAADLSVVYAGARVHRSDRGTGQDPDRDLARRRRVELARRNRRHESRRAAVRDRRRLSQEHVPVPPTEINDDISATEYPIGVFASNDSAGQTEVAEIYAELLVPITSGLDLELGYRYSDFDSETQKGRRPLPLRAVASILGRRCSRGRRRRRSVCAAASSLRRGRRTQPSSYGTDGRYGDVAPATLLILDAGAVGNVRPIRGGSKPKSSAGSSSATARRRSTPGSGGPDAFARPGSPFFPLENAEVQGNPSLGPRKRKRGRSARS